MKMKSFQKGGDFEQCSEATLLVSTKGGSKSTIGFLYKRESLEDSKISILTHIRVSVMLRVESCKSYNN